MIKLFHISPTKIRVGDFIENRRKLRDGNYYAYFAPNLNDAYFWSTWLRAEYEKEDYFFHTVEIPYDEDVIVAEGGCYASWGGGVKMKARDLIGLQDCLKEESEVLVNRSVEVKAVEPFCPEAYKRAMRWLDNN